MYKEIIEKSRTEFEKAVEYFKEEAGKIRTGRASTNLVENLMIDYYGSKSPLKQIASITIPEARTIMISPWDKGSLVYIERAIQESDLNLNPLNDGQVIRINMPALNEERRKELVKVLNQKAEDGKVAIRKCRENVLNEIEDMKKTGKIGEDDMFQGKEILQKVVDEYNTKIDEIKKKKEEDVMTV